MGCTRWPSQQTARRRCLGLGTRAVIVWDVESGQRRQTLEGHTRGVYSVALSGQTAVSASADGTVRVWDVESGQQRGTLKVSDDEHVKHVALSADGTTAVAASQYDILSADGTKTTGRENYIVMWDVESGHRRHIIGGKKKKVRSVRVGGPLSRRQDGAFDSGRDSDGPAVGRWAPGDPRGDPRQADVHAPRTRTPPCWPPTARTWRCSPATAPSRFTGLGSPPPCCGVEKTLSLAAGQRWGRTAPLFYVNWPVGRLRVIFRVCA